MKLRITDKEQIRYAIQQAESHTSGEIVPFLTNRSDSYEEASWKGSFLFAAIAFVAVLFFEKTQWNATILTTSGSVLILFGSGLFGYLLFRFGPAWLQRLAIRQSSIKHRVHQAAYSAFVQKEVFKTKDRTGVLIYISEFEHMVVVLGDTGINRHVEEGEWDAIVQRITKGLRTGNFAACLIQAIDMCGGILERSGLHREADDSNELSDDLAEE